MIKKAVSGIMLTLLLTTTLTLAFTIQQVKTAGGTIYIRADGSIDPSTANIATIDNVTYTFTFYITLDSIVVERNDIVIDGAGYTLQGTGAGYGIDLSGRTNVTVRNTQIQSFWAGIGLSSSSNNSVFNNNIAWNVYGIWLESSSNYNSVSGNNIADNTDGIGLSSSNYNSISGNNIIANNEDGIVLRYSSYNTLMQDNIANGRRGVDLDFSNNNIIFQNNITGNSGQGVLLSRSNFNVVESNNVSANRMHGVEVLDSSNNTIVRNDIQNNGAHNQDWFGVYLTYCSKNTVYRNHIANNLEDGIGLDKAQNNTIIENNVTSQSHGIWIASSLDNTFYHNNFMNITQQVYVSFGFPPPISIWDNDYPSGGNYWDDSVHTDSDGDGISDVSYVIDANNTDRYPLMSPFWYWTNPILGDINKDMKVDIKDIATAAKAYGSYPGHPLWNPHADITGPEYLVPDNKVDIRDIALIAKNYGKTYP